MSVLAPFLASCSCLVLVSAYVGGLYVSKAIRTGRSGISKDHPDVIKGRFKSVAVTCLLAPLYIWYLLRSCGFFDGEQGLVGQAWILYRYLGFPLLSMKLWVAGIFLPVLHVALLFLGPLVLGGFMKSLPGQDRFDFHRDVVAVLSSLIGIRNYIMAPITEEWIFRGCMILLLHLAGFSKTYIIFVAPLYFGLAHIHHTWELFHAGGGNLSAFKRAILITGFQFLYTTVFGWYASFLFMRTGNIMSVIAVHAFCNVMGFPDLGDINLLFPLAKKMTYIAMISGLAIFAKTMYPLTDPSLYGRSLYWT